MKLSLSGFDSCIQIYPHMINVLEIENSVLFSRMCQSLASGLSENAIEPYLLWDESNTASGKPMETRMILSPLALPWEDRDISGKLYARLESRLSENEVLEEEVEGLFRELCAKSSILSFEMQSDYSFSVEWDYKKFLKSFGFSVTTNDEGTLLENTIRFFELLVDIGYKKLLIFVNLKLYFSEKELLDLYNQAIFLGIRILLLENVIAKETLINEVKTLIDKEFVQISTKLPSENPSPCSGDFAPTVLEQ